MNDLLELFPPGSTTDSDGMLTVGGCRADDLAEAFGHTGAGGRRGCARPGFTMSNNDNDNDNGNRRIPVVFAVDGRAREVVRRKTWEDLASRDIA